MKKITVENLDTYVHKDPQLPVMLDRFVSVINVSLIIIAFLSYEVRGEIIRTVPCCIVY